MNSPRHVAVLGGGPSLEHAISLESARAVTAALAPERWRCWPVLWDRAGTWRLSETPATAFDAAADAAPRPAGVAVARLQELGVEVVFPALHGAFGEDGRVQGLLDVHGLRYVGSGVAASAVAMDKLRTREVLGAHGLPLAPGHSDRAPHDAAARAVLAERLAAAVGLPCFLKIDSSGSSYGVARAAEPAAIEAFLTEFAGRRFVAERRLDGEEVSVPVVGPEDALRALPPVGIYPAAEEGFFSSRAKYAAGVTEEVVPPRGLDAAAVDTVQRLALRAHRILDCRHVSRTDMIVTGDGPRLLEVNTLPGMTPASLLPKCAAAIGWPFAELVERLLELAFDERRTERDLR